jgi:hypothetical protein
MKGTYAAKASELRAVVEMRKDVGEEEGVEPV